MEERQRVPDAWRVVLDYDLESPGPGVAENRWRLYASPDGFAVAWVQVDQGRPGVWWVEEVSTFTLDQERQAFEKWWAETVAWAGAVGNWDREEVEG